jgi:Cellulase (glycosyl hydrolase family 5)
MRAQVWLGVFAVLLLSTELRRSSAVSSVMAFNASLRMTQQARCTVVTQMAAGRTHMVCAKRSPTFPVTSIRIRNKAGINPEPGMRPSTYIGSNPDGWWCRRPNCFSPATNPRTVIETDMVLMERLKVGVVRVEFPWPLIEAANGVYDWRRADYIVQEANKHKIQLQPVLVYTPSWAGPRFITSPANPGPWPAFVKHVLRRYKNSVHYWELWNEPDGGGYWADGEQKYVENILIPGYHAAKLADPTSHVLLGGAYFADQSFLNTVYTFGGGNSFDIASFHEYSNVLSERAVQNDINVVRNILRSHGQESKPLWIGEYGSNEGSNRTNDASHITAMRIMLQYVSGYQEALWYNLRDDYAMSCCSPSVTKSAYWGIVQHDGVTKKDGFPTMRHIIATLPK